VAWAEGIKRNRGGEGPLKESSNHCEVSAYTNDGIIGRDGEMAYERAYSSHKKRGR